MMNNIHTINIEKLTPELVRNFFAFMSKKYNSTFESKANAAEMKLISQALNYFSITDGAAFLSRFTTTIGKTIYIPFVIGIPDDNYSLLGQIIVCAHEHQHIIQSNKAGEAVFAMRYLLDPTWRASYEAEAYRVSMAVTSYLTGIAPETTPYLESIKSYGLGSDELDFFRNYLESSLPVIASYNTPDESARVSINWLDNQTLVM